MQNQINNENTDDVKQKIKQLLELKQKTYKTIINLNSEIENNKKIINNIEAELMYICSHEWCFEDYRAMYEKPDKICKLCKSRIIGL